MADDRQIPPEDENIPDWLRDHPMADDDSQAEQPAGPAPSDATDEDAFDAEFMAFGEPEEDDPLSFLRDVGGDPTPGVRDTQSMQPVSDIPARGPLTDDDPDVPRPESLRGMTGKLPWMDGVKPGAAPGDQPPDSGQLRGLTGMLPWQGDLPADTGPAEDAGEEAAIPDWVSGAGVDDDEPTGMEPPAAQAEAPPEWLSLAGEMASDQQDNLDDEAALPDWIETGDLGAEFAAEDAALDEPEAAPIPDWIAGDDLADFEDDEPEFPPDVMAEPDEAPEWLASDMGDLEDEAPIEEGVSYEEWMRQQDEAAYQPSEEELLAAEVPDWFADIGEEAAAEEAPGTGQAAEFVPDWYFGLEDGAAEQKPDWLQNADFSVDALTAQPVLPEEPPTPEPEAAIPQDVAPVEAAADWLDDLDSEGPTYVARPQDAAPSISEPAVTDDGFVDWLGEFEAEEETPVPESPPSPAPEALEPGEMPDWLSALEVPGEEPPDISQPVTTDMVLAGAEEEDFMTLINEELGDQDVMETLGVSNLLPALMPEDVAIDFDRLLKEAELPPDEVGDPDLPGAAGGLEASEMPDWLSGAQVGGFSAVRTTLGTEETPLEELSERLRALRDRTGKAAAIEPPPPAEPPAAQELLANVAGSLPPSVAFDISAGREVMLDVSLDEAQQARAATLAALLGMDARDEDVDPAEEARRIRDAATRARARSRIKPLRLVVTLILAAAVLLPFFVDVSGFFVLPEPGLGAGEHGALDGAIEAWEPGAQVLIGFEYGPTAAGEMDTLTNVLMTHLLVRGVKPVLVSTNPAGILHARNVMAELAQDPFILRRLGRADEPLTMPEDYVILPYLPGGIVGLRSLTATSTDVNALDRGLFVVDIAGEPTGLDVEFLQTAFDLIVVFGERGEDVRQWVEQVGTTIKLPMAAAVSVSAEPIARPYLQSGQLIGLLAGFRDAYKYNGVLEALLSGTPLPGSEDAEPPADEVAEVEPTAEPTAEPVEDSATEAATEEPVEEPTVEATPTQEVQTLAAADITGTAEAELTATATPTRTFVTATPAPEFTPVPTTIGGRTGEMVNVPLPEKPELETRWYSISFGAFAAAALISAGALVNIVRWLRRRRES